MRKGTHKDGAKDSALDKKARELIDARAFELQSEGTEPEVFRLIHELAVHQIELEMQNEELREVRQQLDATASKYTRLFDLAPVCYFTLSREGEIIDLNQRTAQILNRARINLRHSRFGFFISEECKPVFNLFLDQAFKSHSMETCEVRLTITEGVPVYAQLNGIVIKNGDSCLVSLFDITERKRAEDEISAKNRQLQLMNAEKDKLFSIIAHDLRSPFNSLLGFTRMLADELPDLSTEQIQKMAVSMKNSAGNLYNLLENLLEWSRMLRRSVKVNVERVNLTEIITYCMEFFRNNATQKGIELSCNIADNLILMADTRMLQSLMRNLVSNALKFTPKGGKVIITAKPAPNNSVEISVRDTGTGMNKTLTDSLFHIGDMIGHTGTEGEPSSGLGLLICKEYMEIHGGSIRVESEEGKGSTFYCLFPHKPVS